MKLDECLKAWLKFYENCQELAPEGLYDETVAALESHRLANIARTKQASKSAGRKKIPLARQKKIGRDTRLITVVAREYCLSINTVRKYRELFSESTSNS